MNFAVKKEKPEPRTTGTTVKRVIKRDVDFDDLSEGEKMWAKLANKEPTYTIYNRGVQDDSLPPGERCYLEYIVTDKKNYEDINWDKQ